MAAPTRFPSGVTNAAPGTPLGMLGTPDRTKFHEFWDDFDTYTAADWTVTETGTATQALTDADGGVLLITNSAADDDASFSQKVGESFLMEAGKPAWFTCRFQASDATQSDIQIGLIITDTTPLDATDGIYFLKSDGAATISIVCRLNATTGSTTATVGTLTAATMTQLSWYYDGKSTLSYFLNADQVGSLSTTGFLPDTELTVSYGLQNGEAVGKTLSLDYLGAWKAR